MSRAGASAIGGPVVAVIVASDGERWLPRVLAALADSTPQPDVVVAVDNGSRDATPRLLQEALGPRAVVRLAAPVSLGLAVTTGLAAAERLRAVDSDEDDGWLWVLHDDSAPAPDALARLLDAVAADPTLAVAGCRVRAWPRSRRLLEVGPAPTGTGGRDPGVEPGEPDQGQYDEPTDRLAVSGAGMLVRRSAWESLGGFDPRLPVCWTDLDFGWRASAAGLRVAVAPGAVVYDAAAATRGEREIRVGLRRPQRAARAAALYTVLANCRTPALPWLYLRFVGGSLLRALGYLLVKLPTAAEDDLAGSLAALGRPDRILAGRAWRRRQRRGPRHSVRHLLPAWWTPYAQGLDVVRGLLPRRSTSSAPQAAPAPEDRTGWRGWLARAPLLWLLAVLGVAGLVATRGLLGSGLLQGGALWPAPDSATAWWRLLADAAHPIGLGSRLDPSPYVGLLALAALPLAGKAWLLVDVVVLCAPLLAAASAYLGTRGWWQSPAVRVWVATTYGLLPVVIGAVGSGRVGTLVVAVLLPWIARSAVRLLGPEPARWSTAWATALVSAAAAAFAPLAWVLLLPVGGVGVGQALVRRRVTACLQWLVVVAAPVVLLLPWAARVATTPQLLLTEAGAPLGAAAPDAGGWQRALLRVAAAGQAPVAVTAGLVLAALLALLRADTRRATTRAWTVAAGGLVALAALGTRTPTLPGAPQPVHPWLGLPLLVTAAALVAAVGAAADGLRAAVTTAAFGWRQPTALVGALAAVSAPILALGWWMTTGTAGPLHRGPAVAVPPYMTDAMLADGARVLLLQHRSGVVHYRVLAGDGERLGDDSVLDARTSPALTRTVGQLLGAPRSADLARLERAGVRYVVLTADGAGGLAARLDAAGLTRTSTNERVLGGWQVANPTSPPGRPVEPGSRLLLLVGQGVLWLVVLVLALPGARREPAEVTGE